MDVKVLLKRIFSKQSLMLWAGFLLFMVGAAQFFLSTWFMRRGLDPGAVNVMRLGAGGWFVAGGIMAGWERTLRKG